MANINLLTPTSIYGRTVTFSTESQAITSNTKYVIGSAVETGKTHLITGLVASTYGSGSSEAAKIYKRLANQTDVLIIQQWVVPVSYNGVTSSANPGGTYALNPFSKEVGGGFYLQEGEVLVLELLATSTDPAYQLVGYMTYLEIA